MAEPTGSAGLAGGADPGTGGGAPAGGGTFVNPANQPGGGNAGDPAAPAWHASVDAETRGHWTNKGWDVSDPVKLAVAATKAHREADAFNGVPADRMLKLPAPEDTDGMRAVWERLGAPKDAKEYDFSGVKFADGTDVGPEFDGAMRSAFHKLGIPKNAATEVTKELVKFMEQSEAAEKAQNEGKLAAQKAELAKNWGPNFEANKFVARQAAKALGVSDEVFNALDGAIGVNKVMEMFRSIGTRIGEDKFVASGSGDNSSIMTRDQAVARKGELMKDETWRHSYLKGGTKEKQEMHALQILIHGDDTTESRGY